jgi:hypothetical protein
MITIEDPHLQLANEIQYFRQLGWEYSENWKASKKEGQIKVELTIVPIEGQTPFKEKSGIAVVLWPEWNPDIVLAHMTMARAALYRHVAEKFAHAWQDEGAPEGPEPEEVPGLPGPSYNVPELGAPHYMKAGDLGPSLRVYPPATKPEDIEHEG